MPQRTSHQRRNSGPLTSSLRPPAASLYLIDASVFVFRAWYSVPVTLTDPDGNPVNALHGFARFVGDLLERVAPRRVAVAFDESLTSSFRNHIYPPYKANRESAPEELKRQFGLCRELCRAIGLAEFASSEYEADDIIGTLATRARAEGLSSVLVTRDKDLAQLIRPGDEFWDYAGEARYGYDAIEERFGVLPERMADFLALTGDAVDNIPGVPGIGRKTASVLLRHFESLGDLYDRLAEVPKLKFRNSAFVAAQLDDHRDSAFLARQLTGIFCDVPLEVGISGLERRMPDLAAVNALFDTVGFGRMLRNQVERIAAG